MARVTNLLANSFVLEHKLENVVAKRERFRRVTGGERPAMRRSAPLRTPAVQALEHELAELRAQHDGLRHTFFDAAQVQRKLCGTHHLVCKPYEVASEIFPAQDISGDFITIFESDGDLVLAIGDIGGKGLAAGMWFSHVVGTVRLHCLRQRDLAAALTAVNDDLMSAGMELPLTSLLVCRLDIATGNIAYCNAGHPPAILLGRDGLAESLREGGPVLGAIPGASYTAGRTVMTPGSTLLAFSDGVVECGITGGEEFGEHRVLQKLKAAAGSAVTTLFSVLGAVEDFAGGRQREDDLALMVVQRSFSA
jgi:serine phosphatase RsbU (regulator of sigma subunit)